MLVFIFQNTGVATVNFLFWHVEGAGVGMFFLVFLAGIAGGTLSTLYVQRRNRKRPAG